MVAMGCPTFTPQIAPSHGAISTHLLASSLDPAYLAPQMASRSNQPFFHNTLDTHTHNTQTDGVGDITCTYMHLQSIITVTRLIITMVSRKQQFH